MVDLTYTDANGRELGFLPYFEGDFSVGESNTFRLTVPADLGIGKDSRIFADGTEFGGVVDRVETDTAKPYASVGGRTWQGMLEHSVIRPDGGEDHLVVSGEVNAVMGMLIERLGLGFCMASSEEDSGFSVEGYRFARYVDAYAGILSLARAAGCKISFSYSGALRRVVLSAAERGDYVSHGLDGDEERFVISTSRPVNHLIGLGNGDLAERLVVDLYADEEGVVSARQSLFGVAHKAGVYEVNASTLDELEEKTREQLEKLQADMRSCRIVGAGAAGYDIGDIVGAVSARHGVSVVTAIAAKTLTLEDGRKAVETKTELEVSR